MKKHDYVCNAQKLEKHLNHLEESIKPLLNDNAMIDKFQRYQSNLKIEHLFPNRDNGTCACGCGELLTGRKKRWHSKECRTSSVRFFFIIKGDSQVIRNTLYRIDEGFCRSCGQLSDEWHADHIIPVFKGGGASSILNFQTLCPECHQEKTTYDLDRVPNCRNSLTSSLNILPSILDSIWARDNVSSEDIISDTMVGS